MAFAALTIDITAKLANLEQGLGRAEQQLAGFGQRADAIGASIAASFAGIASALTVGAVTSAFKQTIDQLDAFNDASDRTGASVEELSSLLNTLSPYGATLEDLSGVAGLLTKAMRGAEEETSRAAGAFKALGVQTQDAAGNFRPVQDVLEEVARALNQYADGSNKTALAQDILGKGAAQYIPLLKDLANAQRVGATVTAEQAAQAERFNVQLGVLTRSLDAFKVELTGPVLAGLNGLVERFNAAGTSAENFYNRLRLAIQPNSEIARLESDVAGLERKLVELNGLKVLPEFNADRLAEIDKVTARLEKARKALADASPVRALLQRDDPTLRALEDRGFAPAQQQAPRNAAGDPAKGARDARDAYAELDALIRQADVNDELKLQAEAAAELAKQLDRAADAALRRIGETDRVEQDADRALRDEIERVLDLTDPTRALYRERDRLADLEVAGLSSEAANARRAQINSQLDGILGGQIPDRIGEANSAARELGLTFTSAFESAVIGGEKVSKVLQGLAQDFARIFLRKTVTEPAIEALLGKDGKGGLLSDVLGSLFGGARANGGPVGAGTAYLVGERGPELFMPKVSGAIVPNNRIGGAAGGVSIVQNIHVDSRSDRASVVAAMVQAKASAQAEILESMRRGGTFARAL